MQHLITQYVHLIAQALEGGASSGVADRLIRAMKRRGHLSLLPRAYQRALSQGGSKKATVTVAKPEDAEVFASEIATALQKHASGEAYEVVADEKVVGGYIVRAKGVVIDASYRTALVSLYKKIA